MPAVALAVILLLTRPHGAHAGFIGSIESWWHNVFGGGSPQGPASASNSARLGCSSVAACKSDRTAAASAHETAHAQHWL